MLKTNIIFLTFASIFFMVFTKTYADQNRDEVFKCTKSNNVNFRNGPSVKFAILYKVLKRGYPLKIIETIDDWNAVQDFKGDKMWVSSSNLTSKCGKIVKSLKALVRLKPNLNSNVILTLDEGFIIERVKCYQKWCEVTIENRKGWVESEDLWA